ncbi:MAG TPA: thiol:disulfide interchange protein DsbA/DsbL [Burkholderiaceae bacterium]|nr:thiol:disulfide interchange protein DsbA/DsbL [Burkholderiaceae bacterium]
MPIHQASRRRLLALMAASPVLAHTLPRAYAQDGAPPADSYKTVNPVQPTLNRTRIEVLDFFWYGCSHCYAFLQPLMNWKATLPEDVAYRPIPVAFSQNNDNHSRLFYALQSLDRLDLHAAVFAAIHGPQRRRLLATDEIADFAAAQGIDRERWLSAFNSFAIQTHAKRARQVWMGYKIEGTPTLGIDGRYLTSPSMAQGHQAALRTAEALIALRRRQRSGQRP